jgi:hypothetical protein
MIFLLRSALRRRYFRPFSTDHKPPTESYDFIPDLSHPKWKHRDKLSAMNFANKGKSGFRQKRVVPMSTDKTLSKKEIRERRASQRPREQLPSAKTSMEVHSL